MSKNKAGNKNNQGNKPGNAPVPQPAPARQAPAAAGKEEKQVSAQGAGSSFLSRISAEEKICLGLLLCLILLVVVIKSNFLGIPYERDEGAYSYYGKLILEGKIPYKDFYEQKFPGIFYFYALMISLCGDTIRGLHAGFIFINVGTIIMLYYAARTMFTPIAGLITATTFAIVAMDPFLSGFTVQSEHGVAMFFSMGMLFYALFSKNQKWLYLFLMGMSFGCGFLIKTNGVFLGVWGGLMLVIDYIFDTNRSIKQLLGRISIYTVGVFVFIALLFMVILAKGSFKEMMYWGYTFPKEYVGKITWEQGKQMFNYELEMITRNYMFFWIHSVLAIVVCLLPSITFRLKAFTVSLLFFSFLTITPGLYFYGHYWIQLLPGLAMAAGVTYYGIITMLQDRMNIRFKALKYVYLTIFGLFAVSNVFSSSPFVPGWPLTVKDYYFDPDYDVILRAVYGNNPFPEAWEIAEWIKANSKPEDKVLMAGSEPEIYFYLQRTAPTRHPYFTFLVWNVPEHVKWQHEFAEDMEKAKPRYFIFFNHNISLLVQPNTDHFIFDWMQKYVDANYNVVAMVDMVDGIHSIYRCNEGTKTTGSFKQPLNGYKPTSKYIVYIFERKPETTQPQQNGK